MATPRLAPLPRLSSPESPRLAAPPPRRNYVGSISLAVAVVGAATCRAAIFFGAGQPWWLVLMGAGFEAAVVGGLADWFAVTALFRHPLGLPIPHTAIIPA